MIATSNCNAVQDLISVFMEARNLTNFKLEIMHNEVVRVSVEKVVTVDELTRFVTEIKEYELKEKNNASDHD